MRVQIDPGERATVAEKKKRKSLRYIVEREEERERERKPLGEVKRSLALAFLCVVNYSESARTTPPPKGRKEEEEDVFVSRK